MYVIDTNVASELMRPEPTASVAAWIAQRDADELFLTAISEAELRYGVKIVPAGRRKDELEAALTRWLDMWDSATGFCRSTAPAARHYAEIAFRRRRAGRPIQEADCRIAAISRSRGSVLVTRNIRDFEDIDIEVVDPWTAQGTA